MIAFARTCVFVDAGYLFARGAIALTGGQDVKRTLLVLDEREVVARLVAAAEAFGGPGSLLRIYWYDAALPRGLNAEHIRLAETDNVKVRLGVLNDYGRQKGVDSLVITDLIELARNGAMTHAILLSGDDDLRVGVQVIQTFGVRVQLLGIDTARGASQSGDLRREADTMALWDEATLRTFLSLRPLLPQALAPDAGESFAEHDVTPLVGAAPAEPVRLVDGAPAAPAPAIGAAPAELAPEIAVTVQQFAASLLDGEVTMIAHAYHASGKVPYQFDARLLATARTALQRELNQVEKHGMRRVFVQALAIRTAAPALPPLPSATTPEETPRNATTPAEMS